MANFPRVKPAGWALNEIYTSAQSNQLDIDHTKAPNFDDGSSHAPAADILITGPNTIELQGALRHKYASRSIVRVQPLLPVDLGPAPDWAFTFSGNRPILNQTAGGAGDDIIFMIPNLPDGNVLNALELFVEGFAGHANNPVEVGITLPTLELVRQSISSDFEVVLAGPTNDPGGSQATYETPHLMGPTGLAHNIDLTGFYYYARLTGEAGGDFIAGFRVYGMRVTCTVTDQPEF